MTYRRHHTSRQPAPRPDTLPLRFAAALLLVAVVLALRYYRPALLEPLRGSGRVTLAVAPRNVSRMTGQHRANLLALQGEFSIKTLKIVPQPLGEWEICLQTQPAAGIVS